MKATVTLKKYRVLRAFAWLLAVALGVALALALAAWMLKDPSVVFRLGAEIRQFRRHLLAVRLILIAALWWYWVPLTSWVVRRYKCTQPVHDALVQFRHPMVLTLLVAELIFAL